MKLVESCLKPVRYDIVVNGVRYGKAWSQARYDWPPMSRRIVWKAMMDAPYMVENWRFYPAGVLDGNAPEAATLAEAVHRAFEDFATSGAVSDAEIARIGLELFDAEEVSVDILAAM